MRSTPRHGAALGSRLGCDEYRRGAAAPEWQLVGRQLLGPLAVERLYERRADIMILDVTHPSSVAALDAIERPMISAPFPREDPVPTLRCRLSNATRGDGARSWLRPRSGPQAAAPGPAQRVPVDVRDVEQHPSGDSAVERGVLELQLLDITDNRVDAATMAQARYPWGDVEHDDDIAERRDPDGQLTRAPPTSSTLSSPTISTTASTARSRGSGPSAVA